jgi:hypothetical protein
MKLKAVIALEEIIGSITKFQIAEDRQIDLGRGRSVGSQHNDIIVNLSERPEGGPYTNLDFWQGWKEGWAMQNKENLLLFYRAVIAGRVPNDPTNVRIMRTTAVTATAIYALVESGWEIESEPSCSEDVYRLWRCEKKDS